MFPCRLCTAICDQHNPSRAVSLGPWHGLECAVFERGDGVRHSRCGRVETPSRKYFPHKCGMIMKKKKSGKKKKKDLE